MAGLRPMLAASMSDNPEVWEQELRSLAYPLMASPKIDGIRWMKPPEQKAKSRSWKDLPNQKFQALVDDPMFNYLDGEVIVGDDPTAAGLFNRTQSAIMTSSDQNPLSLWVFDNWNMPQKPFRERTLLASEIVEGIRSLGYSNVNYVHHAYLKDPEEVLIYEQEALTAGYEGIMLRYPLGDYKYGRSTLKQQGLIKVKRFTDAEAEIVGFEALERNTNEPTRDSFGLQKRSSHKSGKIPDNLVGRLIVRSERFGEFAIGSGLDVDTRVRIWQNQEAYLGKRVCYKYQAHGTKDKPRTPIYKGIRED